MLRSGLTGGMAHKNISSCTINIVDNISQSWSTREKMGILCVDFSKAFDSIERKFIDNTLAFFGYGPVIRRMVETILNNREARIILGEDIGGIIKVNRGTPQGDKASPYLFILCIEILLIKIESEEGGTIKGCEFNSAIREAFNLESMLNEAYADDLTVMFQWARSGLKRILEILNEFEAVSGLQINIKKTQLMITGGDDERIGDIIEGIKTVDSIEVLGVKIDRKLQKLDENWEKTLRKMVNQSNYWKLFRLSISGRVMIAKTYLISQATYLMGAIPIGDETINSMNEIIIDFVNGNEKKIARERWFRSRELGGYGICDMKIMDLCIKASWIRRWYNNIGTPDYPEVRALKGNKIEPDLINMEDINKEGWKCLGEIMCKWIEYKSVFYRVAKNSLEMLIFGNEIFLEGGGSGKISVMGRAREIDLEPRMKTIKLKEVLGRNLMLKDKNDIDELLGTRMTFAEFFRLRTEVNKLKNNLDTRGKLGRRLKTIFKSKRKGSRVLRNEIQSNETREYFDNNVQELPMVRRLLYNGEDEIGREISEVHMALWGKLFLEPGLKNFLFRYVQGRLFTNQNRANIDEDQERGCTFCTAHNRARGIQGNVVEEETIIHLFWDCNYARTVIEWLGNEILGRQLTVNEFMVGKERATLMETELIMIFCHWTKYWIYIRKMANRLIVLREFKTDWEDFKSSMLRKQRFCRITLPVRNV